MANTRPLDERLAKIFNFLPTFPDLAEHFLTLFPRRDIYICKLPRHDKWRTWHGPLEDHQILGVIADGGRGLLRGCHWGAQTRHAVLDVDTVSQYHNSKELAELVAAVAAVGLKANIYQSSENGGWHLYIPFKDWESSSEVEHTFKRWLKALGYEIRGGQLEVFPSGNALRLPLQPGFAWVSPNGDLIRKREEISRDEGLGSFIVDFELSAVNWTEARKRMESHVSEIDRAAGRDAKVHQQAISCEGFEDLFTERTKYRIIPEYCDKARKYWVSGVTKEGNRHEAIYTIQHLLWHGDSFLGVPQLPGRRNAERRFQVLKDWIEANHNGNCNHINRGDWKSVEAHIRRVCYWQRIKVKGKSDYVPYMKTQRLQDRIDELQDAKKTVISDDFFSTGNDRREGEARIKIKRAVGDCLQEGRQISRSTLEAITGCSPNTVRKHADLWKYLSTGSGVLISGGAGPYCPMPEIESSESVELVILETTGAITELDSQALGNAFESDNERYGNSSNVLATSIFPIGNNDLYPALRLAEASAAKPSELVGSDSVPLRRLLCEPVERAQKHKKLLLRLLKGGAAKNSSSELAPIVLTPVFPLPGYEPTSEHPASRPSPAGSFGSLDAGSLVHWFSGRAADGATGFEQAARTQASRGPPAAISLSAMRGAAVYVSQNRKVRARALDASASRKAG